MEKKEIIKKEDVKKEELLLNAAKEGNNILIKELVKSGANINCQNEKKVTPLLAAIRLARTETAELLLELGADVNVVSQGYSCVGVAAVYAEPDMIKLLMQHGARIERHPDALCSPISLACIDGKKENVECLISLGVDVNELCHEYLVQETPLMFAAKNGHHEIVKILIDAGADMNIFSDDVLLHPEWRYENKYTERESSYSAFMRACLNNHKEVIKVMIDAGVNINQSNDKGWTPLIFACMYGLIDVVKILIENGANLNIQDNDNKATALMWTINNMLDSEVKKLLEIDFNVYKEIAKLLIDSGADVNIQTKSRSTPISILALFATETPDKEVSYECIELIKYLAEAGANPYIKNARGHNTFYYLMKRGYKDLVVELTQKARQKI